jgi:hypothetical protein
MGSALLGKRGGCTISLLIGKHKKNHHDFFQVCPTTCMEGVIQSAACLR